MSGKYDQFEEELKSLIIKFSDDLKPIQIIALLEVTKATYTYLNIREKLEEVEDK